jgi:hypothetical protein
MYVVPLLFPAGFFVAFGLGRLFPGLPDGAFAALAILGPMACVTGYAFWSKARDRRAAGLVPAAGGYSAQLSLLATKLRERADEIDAALRFGREVSWGHELESFAEELRRTAQQLERRELAAFLTHDSFVGGSTEGVAKADWLPRAQRLREAAAEIEAYAEDVRARGGVFRGKPHEVVGCSIVLLAMAAGAAWLIFVAGGWFWWGVALVGLTSLLTWALFGSQTDPA